MTPEILNQTVADSFGGARNFGEIVGQLIIDEVEWYSANLRFGVSTFYAADGSHHQTAWPSWRVLTIAEAFAADQVLAAIRASQKGEHRYPEFLQKIAEAGCVYYTVHLQGRKAIYFGRHGDFYIEPFPQV